MQHDLVGVLGAVSRVALTPVVGNRVGKDLAVPVEGGRRNGSTNRRIALETVLGVLVPGNRSVRKLIGTRGRGTHQKWKVPSEPAVEKVPKVGWKEMALTLNTLVMELWLGGVSRWHLKEKFMLGANKCQLRHS